MKTVKWLDRNSFVFVKHGERVWPHFEMINYGNFWISPGKSRVHELMLTHYISWSRFLGIVCGCVYSAVGWYNRLQQQKGD